MTPINEHPITVHADADGITIRGRNDVNRSSGADGEDFALILFNHAEAVLLDAHLRTAQDDYLDADVIGTLLVDGRLVGAPNVMSRVRLAWTDTDPAHAVAEVFLGAEVAGDKRALAVTLTLDTISGLRRDVAAAITEVPAEAEFHVWDDHPGRVFDPNGGRDWVFADYVTLATGETPSSG